MLAGETRGARLGPGRIATLVAALCVLALLAAARTPDADAAPCNFDAEGPPPTLSVHGDTFGFPSCDFYNETIKVSCIGVSLYVDYNGAGPSQTAYPCAGFTTIKLVGSGGDDLLDATALTPAAGFTSLTAVILDGGPGDDRLVGGPMAEGLVGSGGEDTMSGGGSADLLLGGAGFDQGFGGPGADTAFGGAGPDTLRGGPARDKLYGEDGADLIKGDAGADRLDGAAGGDFLLGGGAADLILGGAGIDVLIGGGGKDTLKSGPGRDFQRP